MLTADEQARWDWYQKYLKIPTYHPTLKQELRQQRLARDRYERSKEEFRNLERPDTIYINHLKKEIPLSEITEEMEEEEIELYFLLH